MNIEHPSPRPRLALALPSGQTIDVPDDLVAAILAAEPAVRREVAQWSRMFGLSGRVILIDPELVARILDGWPQIR
jgi:hypothetical protein